MWLVFLVEPGNLTAILVSLMVHFIGPFIHCGTKELIYTSSRFVYFVGRKGSLDVVIGTDPLLYSALTVSWVNRLIVRPLTPQSSVPCGSWIP